MMVWDALRYFLVVARSPSIREAAKTMKVSHSTVLRQLNLLEEQLETRLFDRNSVGFQLTAAGEDVFRSVLDIEESTQYIQRIATGRDTSLEGLVSINMPEILTHPSVLPDFSEFKQSFSKIKIKINQSYRMVDLNKREADIAVRLTNTPPDDLVGRKIGKLTLSAYCTNDYALQHKPLSQQSKAEIIAYGTPEKWNTDNELLENFSHLDVTGYFDNVLLQIELTKQGLGVGIIPTTIADQEPMLVRLVDESISYDIWIVYHTDLRYTSRVRVVRDFLVKSYSEKLSH